MAEKEKEKGGEREQNPFNEVNALEQELQTLQQRARRLSKNSRKRLGREHGISFNDTDSATSASSIQSDTSEASDSSTTSNERRRRKRKKRNSKSRKNKNSMSKLLRTQQGVLKSVVQKITSPDEPNDITMRTLSNAFSKQMINEALKNERKYHHTDNSSDVQFAIAPKLDKNSPASAKDNKDAITTLKDMISTRVTGEEVEGVHEYLSACARVATSCKLNFDQMYDLIKSRILPTSTLYREVTNNFRKRTSLRELFKELCSTYTGGSSYYSCFRRYNEFTGQGLSASQYLSKLKNLAHDLAHSDSSQDIDDIDAAIYKSVKEKTMALLPAISSEILERYNMERRGSDKGKLSVFTSAFMKYADRVEQQLHQNSKAQKIKLIRETDSNDQTYNHDQKKKAEKVKVTVYSTSEDETPKEVQLIHLLKLSRADLDRLKNCCYKCGSQSPFQKPDHYSKECLLYKGDPLAMYVCALCSIGVHLPSLCKQSAQGKQALEDKAKELGLPLTTKTSPDGQIFAIIEKNC
jgi:hypothetical protein